MSVVTSTQFDWKDEYSVGVERLDKQHQHFFQLMKNLHLLTETDQVTDEQLRQAISGLSEYAKYHFCSEEGIFDQVKYPEAQPHCAAHAFYMQQIVGFQRDLDLAETDKRQLSRNLLEFAADWLIGHIVVKDKKYSQCFKQHGVK